MIRFVIVEDEAAYIKKTRNIIDKFKYKYDENIKIYECAGYSKTLQNLINDTSDKTIYVLDIELKGDKSGIEIASLIRDVDWDSEIIFITNHDKMFETVHRSVYDVFDFIEKCHNFDKRLENDIKVILSKKADRKVFTYKGRNVDLEIYLHSINYIYRDKEERKLIIETDYKSYTVALGVKEILELLDDRFKMVHRSCIVNTDKVNAYDWSNLKVIMKNGKEVNYLSKKYKGSID